MSELAKRTVFLPMSLSHNIDAGWWFIGYGKYDGGPWQHLVSVPDYAPDAAKIARRIFALLADKSGEPR